jgi:LytS/YehU family sensor histidine kinase
MLAKLSDFLRTVLSSSSVQHVTLDEELSIENMYVDIMKARLERSLQLRVRVDDAARDSIVPFMILQPLLENSIRHGAVPSRSAMAIDIDVTRLGEFTVIRVADDGAGISGASPRGHGLRNVRDRLHYAYGDAAAFSLAAGPGGGAVATLTFPSIPRNGTCASS